MIDPERDRYSAAATYYGACPECGGCDGYRNSGREQWFICEIHRNKWYVGSNLFTSWCHETPEERQDALKLLASYHTVDPIDPEPPKQVADPAFDAFMRKAIG